MLSTLIFFALPLLSAPPVAAVPSADPPEIVVGEALFMETRFAEYFARHATGINEPLAQGDPVMDATATTHGDLAGPFRGTSMNCRACHLVDEFAAVEGNPGVAQGGMRSYADFAQRSPVPRRNDGLTVALRNTPSQVNVSIARDLPFFHSDGQFTTMEDLVRETLQGRNFGWLVGEQDKAQAHIACVIREDAGMHPLALTDAALAEFSYAEILRGTGPDLPPSLTLPERYRLDVPSATDAEVVNAVSELIAVYVTDLAFSQDERGYNTSPYDVFLRQNELPTAPSPDESARAYGRRLLSMLEELRSPAFVSAMDGDFTTHDQVFEFGAAELEGLKIFLREARVDGAAGGVGNCAACHCAPHFTDFLFHNNGAAQEEYDAVHGAGQFALIDIPSCTRRQAAHDRYLPGANGRGMAGGGPFADIPGLDKPGHTDLGLWNVYLNAAMPIPQDSLARMMQHRYPDASGPDELLAATIAAFKTPGLRDLGHSDPYFHTGRFDDLESTVRFYMHVGKQARAGEIRNADVALSGIHLAASDIPKLAAFLRALNEDYL